jgi:hypothetical protein
LVQNRVSLWPRGFFSQTGGIFFQIKAIFYLKRMIF